ncbi:condensation domain-containing protein [Isoalcanivorax beigongshangi]|uniref:Condensation domain-containing protein n=1 Tax=Isoalcanivorax beigongshangi TaxID=3238810 RepID=A0ABV4AEU0_9GAMM
MQDHRATSTAADSLSDHEAEQWLLQQQQPQQLRPRAAIWLLDQLDTDALGAALTELAATEPALHARYRFSDDGELTKHWPTDAPPWSLAPLTCHGALATAVDRDTCDWDLATQPPLAIALLNSEDGLALRLQQHPVLAQPTPDQLFSALAQHYLAAAGQPLQARPVLLDTLPVSPQDQAEALILACFRRLLEQPTMGADDDFFDYGGHSLLATRIIGTLLAAHQLELRFNDFFEAPNAAALARRAQPAQRRPQQQALSSAPSQRVPMAWAQASLWRAQVAYQHGPVFNLPFALALPDGIDESVLEQAIADLVQRHSSLRTTYHGDALEGWQQVVPPDQLTHYRWFWSSADSIGLSLAQAAAHCFDLSAELPLRVRVLRDAASGAQQLSLLVHHLAVDEWSVNTLIQDLALAYQARSAGIAPPWPAPAAGFELFAAQQAAQPMDPAHLGYWTEQLQGARRGLTLPGMLPATSPSAAAAWLSRTLPSTLSAQLPRSARCYGSSLFGLVYTAIAATLHRLGQLPELVLGTSTAGRDDARFFDTVGYFTVMTAHRVRFAGNPSLAALLKQVTHTLNTSMQYADIPLEQVQQALGMGATDGLLFDVYVQIHADNALNGALTDAAGTRLRYRQIDADKTESMFGLQFEIMDDVLDDQRRLRLVVTYRVDRYPPTLVAQICDGVEAVLSALCDPQQAEQPLQHSTPA